MPADDVERFLDLELVDFLKNSLSAMDIARIMSEFNVSFDMALNRLENLGKINTDEKLKELHVYKIFENNVNDNRLLYGTGDLGEVYAIALA